MKAEKMFRKLGYKKYQNKYDKQNAKEWGQPMTIRYKKGYFEITFDCWDQDVTKTCSLMGREMHSSIDMEELQAINQQVMELGWIDDKN